MNLTATRLKKSTKPYAYQGQTVYVFHQAKDDKLVITTDINFIDGFTFPNVELSELEPVFKMRAGISSKPKPLTPTEIEFKASKNDFYKGMANLIPFHCENCHKPLYAFNSFAQRSVTCHILPKCDFPEIATNADNIVFMGCSLLGVCECHGQYDGKGAEYRAGMPIYPKVLEQFKKLKPCLTQSKLIKAYDYLNITS